MIEIRGLKKSYGELPVLNGVDLSIGRGEVAALIGRSGCGKSTLLRCVNFLESYQEGSIELDGQRLWYSNEQEGRRQASPAEVSRTRQRMGIVFQQYNLFPHMTALQNVTLGPIESQKVPAKEARERGFAVLARVGLDHKADAYPSQLSGGQQQRVAIARALAMRPDVLLLDEATSALDPELVAEVEDVIKDLRKERITMILVTHSMAFARELADTVTYLVQGKVAETGPASDVLERPQDPTLKELLRRIR